MSNYIVDVEADGPIPPKYSMVNFGVVKVTRDLNQTFYGETKPISSEYITEALNVSGFSRKQHLTFDDPKKVFSDFADWLDETSKGRPIFWSDNVAFDWQWINYYLHTFAGRNPFGYSGRRIGDAYSGLVNDPFASSKWKKLRKTKHSHHPVDDAMGNAEALLEIREKFGYNISLE